KTPSSSSSSSESRSESVKDLLRYLTVDDVKAWLRRTMFHQLVEAWFTHNVDGKELIEISRTGCLTNETFMISGYELISFKDILNRFGFEFELD
ncbi:unnamed protein product, partial [Didymodactylos carnosus]